LNFLTNILISKFNFLLLDLLSNTQKLDQTSEINTKLSINPEDSIYYEENQISAQSTNVLAVSLLLLGLSIFFSFFVFLILSSKYVKKRIDLKLFKFAVNENKNVEVDGDYLINGMYL